MFGVLHRDLADEDNRGKLNRAEFHTAMALIYRRAFACCVNHPRADQDYVLKV